MQQVDFSSGSVRRSILAVAAPMMTAQILNLLYNIVDRIYIGKIPGEGTIALSWPSNYPVFSFVDIRRVNLLLITPSC